jgi:hypothetical protein
MAIRTYIEHEKKYFEVYINGHDTRGIRIQWKKRKIETLRKAEMVEFEMKRELARLKEEKVPFRWSEWFSECLKRIKITGAHSTFKNYEKTLNKWVSSKWGNLELHTITKSQVYNLIFEGMTISISKQWTSKAGFTPTKTQRARIVPISQDLALFLKELKLKRQSDCEFVLPHHTEWENGDQARVTREFCEAVGITPVKFHDLRATFITNLLSRGVALAQVMSIVGHSQLKTTNGYLRKAGVEVRGVTEHLGYRLPEETEGAQVLSLVRD